MARWKWIRWSDEEDAILRKFYPQAPMDVIKKSLPNRTINSIHTRARCLGIRRDKEFWRQVGRKAILMRKVPIWPENQLEELRKLYPTCSKRELEQKFKRPWKYIMWKASQLGLKRTSRYSKTDPEDIQPLNLSDIQKGYIAGILDGEGYLGLVKKGARGRVFPLILVANTNSELIEKCREMLGFGRIRKVEPGPHLKTQYHLIFKLKDVARILKTVGNLLIAKHEQAKILDEFISKLIDGNLTPEDEKVLYQKMRTLNRRGR